MIQQFDDSVKYPNSICITAPISIPQTLRPGKVFDSKNFQRVFSGDAQCKSQFRNGDFFPGYCPQGILQGMQNRIFRIDQRPVDVKNDMSVLHVHS
jgi:hypothetical protein